MATTTYESSRSSINGDDSKQPSTAPGDKSSSSFEAETRPWKFWNRVVNDDETSSDAGESFDKRPESNRRIGTLSAVMLITNRMIGTGIFATPASIVNMSGGSIGLALMLWVIGGLIASAGLAVYLEFATALPRSGGEKTYLSFFYTRPLYLVSCAYAAYAALLGWPSGNSVYTGTMLLNAAQVEPSRWAERGIGAAVVTGALLVHACTPRIGLYLQNFLGIFKIVVLLFIIVTGFVALGQDRVSPSNFTNAFEGATNVSAASMCSALYSVIWAFIGYSNAFYALSEVRNPIRTAKRAAPLALLVVTILYMLVNIAFFAAVPKSTIISSNRLLAAEFFGIMFNSQAANRAVSVLIALSAIGNVLSVLFGQGRINQELGREALIPFSKFFASNKPFDTPFAGLALQWAVTLVIILAPPGGDVYAFLLNLISYPLNCVNVLVSVALLLLTLRRAHYNWQSPIRATLPVIIFFLLANLFLVVVPLVKPDPGQEPYTDLPYWLHVVVGLGIFGLGAVYWLVWAQILPRIGGYKLVQREEVGSDGLTRQVFFKERKQQ